MSVVASDGVALAPEAAEPFSRSLREGHTLQLDARLLGELQRQHQRCLMLQEGLVRVAIHGQDPEQPEASRITLAFLRSGDWLPLDLLRHERLQLQALRPARLVALASDLPAGDASSLSDWTVALLRIRHLAEAEQRIGALLRLLVERLGRRCGGWYELPVRLTHAELAELTGHNRVTVTRQLSRWRAQGLIAPEAGLGAGLRLAPALVEGWLGPCVLLR